MADNKLTPQQRYIKKYLKQIKLSLNTRTDQDILERLDNVPSVAGYIKQLIREDIKKQG